MTSDQVLPVFGAPLTWPPLGVLLACLVISPILPEVLATTIERRPFHPRSEFWALVYGDPLLAVFVAVAVALSASSDAIPAGLTASPWVWAVPLLSLAFGAYQWISEYRHRFYTAAQSLSPTKIYHQVVIYPLLGYWVWVALVVGVSAPITSSWIVLGKLVMLACGLGWIALLVYDSSRPKLGHAPFDWRRMEPAPKPWAPDSETLRAGA